MLWRGNSVNLAKIGIAILFVIVIFVVAIRASDLPGECPNIPSEKSLGDIQVVACFNGPMPTGVTVSHSGRIFVNFPKWGDQVEYTVAEIKDGKTIAYPSVEINKFDESKPAPECLVSVQSVVVDPKNRLWILDTGRIEWGAPKPGGPKLVGVDLATDKVFKTISIPDNVALPDTYLNDVRFDLRRGKDGTAFITDSSGANPGIIVVDLDSGKSFRKLTNHESVKPLKDFVPIVEGKPLMRRPPNGDPAPVQVGADGIAISNDGKRLFYCPLSSWRLFSVSVDALADPNLSDEETAKTVKDEGDKAASDGLESDAEGNLYVTSYDHNAILKRSPTGEYTTLVYDPRVLWPDTLSVAADGYLYFIANQLHRQKVFNQGKDLREKPYVLFRTKINAKPVMLK
jgi:sugar lactone lactonase YvrE